MNRDRRCVYYHVTRPFQLSNQHQLKPSPEQSEAVSVGDSSTLLDSILQSVIGPMALIFHLDCLMSQSDATWHDPSRLSNTPSRK